jgi:hypothetical protein
MPSVAELWLTSQGGPDVFQFGQDDDRAVGAHLDPGKFDSGRPCTRRTLALRAELMQALANFLEQRRAL